MVPQYSTLEEVKPASTSAGHLLKADKIGIYTDLNRNFIVTRIKYSPSAECMGMEAIIQDIGVKKCDLFDTKDLTCTRLWIFSDFDNK